MMTKINIGNGSLWLGDCLELMKQIPDGSIDMVVTDPAYQVISGGNKSILSDRWNGSILARNDGKIFEHNSIKTNEYLPILYRIIRKGGHCYIMTNNLNLRDLLNQAESVGFNFHNLLRWDKNNKTANRWYMKDCEYTVFLYKKPAKSINNMSSSQGFKCDNIRDKNHPTQKPVELMEHYIKNSSNEGDLILDPFSGSGTTAIACENTNRRWICIEKDPEYYLKSMFRIRDKVMGI